jgi:hypothetical protein
LQRFPWQAEENSFLLGADRMELDLEDMDVPPVKSRSRGRALAGKRSSRQSIQDWSKEETDDDCVVRNTMPLSLAYPVPQAVGGADMDALENVAAMTS